MQQKKPNACANGSHIVMIVSLFGDYSIEISSGVRPVYFTIKSTGIPSAFILLAVASFSSV